LHCALMSKGIMFSGQGAQKVGMGQSLAAGSVSVCELYERADSILGWSLSEICFDGPEEKLTMIGNSISAIRIGSERCR